MFIPFLFYLRRLCVQNTLLAYNSSSFSSSSCKKLNSKDYLSYFKGMNKMYENKEVGTCLPIHRECGWSKQNSHLPQFSLVIGLEGSAHHFWTQLLYTPIFDCVWVIILSFSLIHSLIDSLIH